MTIQKKTLSGLGKFTKHKMTQIVKCVCVGVYAIILLCSSLSPSLATASPVVAPAWSIRLLVIINISSPNAFSSLRHSN